MNYRTRSNVWTISPLKSRSAFCTTGWWLWLFIAFIALGTFSREIVQVWLEQKIVWMGQLIWGLASFPRNSIFPFPTKGDLSWYYDTCLLKRLMAWSRWSSFVPDMIIANWNVTVYSTIKENVFWKKEICKNVEGCLWFSFSFCPVRHPYHHLPPQHLPPHGYLPHHHLPPST